MRILAVSDLHYCLPQFDWLLAHAAEYDLVVVSGDLLDIAGMLDPDAQIVVVSKYIERLGAATRTAVCSGNHDGDEKNELGEFVATWLGDVRSERVHVDGDMFLVGDDLVSVCPWWDGDFTRAEVEALLDGHASHRRGRWTWIHHCPPDHAAVSWTGKRHAGDPRLEALIARHRPDFIFSGHIHNAPFYGPEGSWISHTAGAWTFNPGKQTGPVPAFVVVDTAGLTARFLNLEGEQVMALNAGSP